MLFMMADMPLEMFILIELLLLCLFALLVGLAIKEGIFLWNAIKENRENKRIEETLHDYAEAVRLDYKNSMKIKERKKWLQYHMEF